MGRHSAQSEPVGRNRHILMLDFELSLNASAARVFAALGDLAQWPQAEHPRMLVRKESRVALSFDDATRVTISIEAIHADLPDFGCHSSQGLQVLVAMLAFTHVHLGDRIEST